MVTETVQKERMEIARMRFGMIAPVIQDTYPDPSVSAYCRRVSQSPQRLPDGRVVQYQAKTLEKWVSLYRKGGMDALLPKTRCDKGSARVITSEAEREIERLKKEYPRLNATQIHGRLVQEAVLPASVSVSSVQRYIKRTYPKGNGIPEAGKDRKAFEEAYFGGMWQADTCYLPYIHENGCSRRTYLIMILDDHSRMIVGGKLFYQENSVYQYWGKRPGKSDLNPELLFQKPEKPTKSFHWGVVHKQDNKVIGDMWVYLIENDRMAKMAFRLSPAYQGNRLMTEALARAAIFCFEETELQRLWADVHAQNIAS